MNLKERVKNVLLQYMLAKQPKYENKKFKKETKVT